MAELAHGNLDRPVPTCPDWDVAGLLAHTARVYGFVEATRAAGSAEAPVRVPGPEPDDTVIDAFVEAGDALSRGLRESAGDAPLWSWTPDATVGFWRRRTAFETIIHRVDLELAIGLAPGAVDADLAADGIDEWLDSYVIGREQWRSIGHDTASVHLHCTDADGEWMLRIAEGQAVLTREHAKGDVAVRGPAWPLLLAGWRRAGTDGLEVFGDGELFAAITEAG